MTVLPENVQNKEPFNYPAPLQQSILRNQLEVQKYKAQVNASDVASRVKLS